MVEDTNHYRVAPKGWMLIDFTDACEKVSLNSIKVKQKDYLNEGLYPVVDQGQELIGGYFNDEGFIVPQEPPYIIFGDHTKIKKFINFRFIAGADGVKVLKPNQFYDPLLFYYFLHVIKLPDRGYARHFQFLERSEMPLPPLPEQHRIVAKIQELFSELDKGVEALKTAQQQLKVYRQAVLKWAFEGKLTKEWRKQQSSLPTAVQLLEKTKTKQKIPEPSDINDKLFESASLPNDWIWTKLDLIAQAIDPQPSHRTPPVFEGGIPYIGIGDIDKETGQINFIAARKVSPDVLQEHASRYTINDGDFVIGKIGTIGKPFKVPTNRAYTLSANIVLVQAVRLYCNCNFLYYLLKSTIIEKQFFKGSKATTQAAFGIQKVRELLIPYCSLAEQQAIVQEIESRLSVADKMEEAINQSLAQAEALRQSILKKAFEGRLVPQDPNDEPAGALLARIKTEREKDRAEGTPRKRQQPRKTRRMGGAE